MSSTYSGPYQSKVLSFVSEQSRRLIERGEQDLKRLNIDIIWGVQLILYPVYMMLQTSRLAGKQLRAATQQALPLLQAAIAPPPTCDTPIQNVLLAISDCLQHCALRNHPIRGIATQLTTRSLVLVTSENQILEVLPPEQQDKLQRKIIWEIADLARYQRLTQHSWRSLPGRLQSLANRNSVTLPARIFWQLMAWVENGSVAIAANLFQESTVPNSGANIPLLPAQFSVANAKFLTTLDHSFAKLEVGNWQPVNQIWNRSYEFVQHHSEVVIDYWQRTRYTRQKMQNWFQDATDSLVKDYPRQRRSNQKLIVASTKPVNSPSVEQQQLHLSASTEAMQPDDLLPVTTQAEPWLTFKDLFDSSTTSEVTAPPTATSSLNLESDHGLAPAAGTSSLRDVKNLSSEPCIETEAVSVGYVKHPLEQLLEWIDQGLAWLEKLVQKLWHLIAGDRI